MRDIQRHALAKLLIVDDEPSIRTSISMVLTEVGYPVRSAQDGFSALAEIRKDRPNIILSDLNMPGMSGFELLSVVHRRFPAIRAIAMSGSFSGDEVPSGVAADAFYPKGSGIRFLLKIIGELPDPERSPAMQPATSAPLWIERSGLDTSGDPYVSINCPECLRTFQQTFGGSFGQTREAHCVHCGNAVYYAIAEPGDRSPGQAHPRSHRVTKSAGQSQLQC